MAEAVRGEKVKGLYFSETLQLRSFFNNKIAKFGLVAAYIATFIVYSILIWGRPDQDYWSDDADRLGGEVNLTLCESPDRNEFVRLPANALGTISPVYVGIFILLIGFLDIKDKRSYDSGIGNKPASILLRFPVWSIFLGLNFIFLGISGLFFFATTMSIFSTVFTVAQWSTILGLCFCAVNRLLDPAVKTPSSRKKCIGNLIMLIFMTAHIALTALLILNLETKASDEVDDGERTLTSELPTAVMYGLVTLAIICAVVHWRTHSLTIKQQPVLLFLGGVVAVIAAGFDSYDNTGGVACYPNSVFQLGAFGFFLLNIAGLIAYLFFRGDNWEDNPIEKTTKEMSASRLPLVNLDEDEERGRASAAQAPNRSPMPENLGAPRNTDSNNAPHTHGFIGGLDQMFRRATTEMVRSRYVTPELGFSASQIRLAEIVIGLLIIAFIVVVIYFSFSASL